MQYLWFIVVKITDGPESAGKSMARVVVSSDY